MKGKLDKHGTLAVERAGKLNSQSCPFGGISENVPCGDWCPLFREPMQIVDSKIMLVICRDTLIFSELLDERPRP